MACQKEIAKKITKRKGIMFWGPSAKSLCNLRYWSAKFSCFCIDYAEHKATRIISSQATHCSSTLHKRLQ